VGPAHRPGAASPAGAPRCGVAVGAAAGLPAAGDHRPGRDSPPVGPGDRCAAARAARSWAAGHDGGLRLDRPPAGRPRGRRWEPQTGRLVRPLVGTADQLVSAVFCPTSPMLATTSNDGGIHMWHLNTWRAEQELDVATEHVWASAFDPDGEVLATANDDD